MNNILKKNKIVRLVDVGELEARLRETLEEKLRETDLDEIAPQSESISCEIEDLGSLPTIDPERLRPVSEWELNPYRFSCEHFRCKKCAHIDCVADNYCGKCGARMKNAGVKPEDLPIPEE